MTGSTAPDGLWVAVLGPDGTGKSTLIAALERRLGPEFAAVRRHHLRPHFGSPASTGEAVRDPHGREPRGAAGSIAKLAWYWFDCVAGWVGWIRPALRRGELVVFDRYVDDLVVDPRRYRYGASPRWARLLTRLVPRPDEIVVLDAPVEVIRQRVREVAPDEIERQRRGYRELARSASNAWIVDASRSPEAVASEVERRLRRRRDTGSTSPTGARR